MGCFWGAEHKFWETEGVHTTAVGYAGGFAPNRTYKEVCSGLTGHAEVVLVCSTGQGRQYLHKGAQGLLRHGRHRGELPGERRLTGS
jgi:peptide methionine sulfoxide reductase MsrA